MALQSVPFTKPRGHDPRISPKYVPGRHAETYWREEELQVLRDYYPTGGVAACLAHLPNRKQSGVYGMAHKLGLRAEKLTQERKSWPFTPELDATIQEEWSLLDGKKRGGVEDLAAKLGLPRHILSARAAKLGLQMPHKKEPDWSAAELHLITQVPLHDIDKCALIFRENGFQRTPNSIKVRATRLKISRRATRPELSANRVAKLLGVDAKGVSRWIESGDLKATKRQDKRTAQQGGAAYDILKEDLKAFIVARLEYIDFRKVEKFEFVAILTGEPA